MCVCANCIDSLNLGWSNPCGGMLASANDMAILMKLLFRNNISANSTEYKQLFDGIFSFFFFYVFYFCECVV